MRQPLHRRAVTSCEEKILLEDFIAAYLCHRRGVLWKDFLAPVYLLASELGDFLDWVEEEDSCLCLICYFTNYCQHTLPALEKKSTLVKSIIMTSPVRYNRWFSKH